MKNLKLSGFIAILSFSLLFSGCEKNNNYNGTLQITFDGQTFTKALSDSSFNQVPAAVYISVMNEELEYVLNFKRLPLLKMGNTYITENVQMETGKYTVEDFIVVDQYDTVLYLSPKKGSEFEQFVNKPIPVKFEVYQDIVTPVVLEVVPAFFGEPEKFGYAIFSFKIIDPTPIKDGLVVYYPFRGNTNDYSGNNFDAIPYGPVLTTNQFDCPNSAYYFDGIDDYMHIWNMDESNQNINTNEGAISIWFSPDTIKPGFMYEYFSDHDDRLYLLIHDDGRLRVGLSEEQYILEEGVKFNLEEWYHFVINWRDNGGVDIYINGELSYNLSDYTPGFTFQGNEDFELGRGWTLHRRPFGGKIGEFRLYNRPVSRKEVCRLYHGCCMGV